jgi:hypothetical protein
MHTHPLLFSLACIICLVECSDLDVVEAKTPEDVYKTHLVSVWAPKCCSMTVPEPLTVLTCLACCVVQPAWRTGEQGWSCCCIRMWSHMPTFVTCAWSYLPPCTGFAWVHPPASCHMVTPSLACTSLAHMLIQAEGRQPTGAAVDSARQNLASSFVNAFVNAGFGQDKLVTAATEVGEGATGRPSSNMEQAVGALFFDRWKCTVGRVADRSLSTGHRQRGAMQMGWPRSYLICHQ